MNITEAITSFVNRASIARSQKNDRSALDDYSKALAIAKTENRSRLVAVILDRMGDTFQAQGEIQDAVIAYEAALQALESPDQLKANSVIDRLSRVPKGFYNNPETIPDLYSTAVAQTLEAAENDPTLAIRLWLNVGNAYLRQPQEAPALNAYHQALQYPEIATNPLLQAYAIANIGEIHRRQDKLDLAETELNQALQLFDNAGTPLEKRRAIAFLAALHRNRQQFDRAETLYQQALSLYEQAQDHLGKGRTLAALGRLYLEQKRWDDARSYYQQAQELAQTENDREVLGYCYWGLGCCHQAAGELTEAITSLEESLNLIELRQQDLQTDEGKVSFLDSIKDVFDRLLIAHLDLAQRAGGDYQAALEIAEQARGRALNDLMGGRVRQPLPPPPDPTVSAVEEVDIVSDSPVQAAPGIPVSPSHRDHQADAVTTDRSIVATPLARLVFYVLLDRIAIFAVTPEGQVSGHVSPIGCHELEEKVARLRRAMQVDEASRGLDRKLIPILEPIAAVPVMPVVSVKTLLQEFYLDLVAPVVTALPTADNMIVIEPHAALWLVPFAALQLPDRTWLSDRWSLIYSPSAQTLAEIRQEPCYATLEKSKVLVVGNPVMPKILTEDGREIVLAPLSGAEAEARSIAGSLGDHQYTLLLQAEATESAVKDLTRTHNIIHLATHGIAYTADPLASLVVLAPTATENGLLTAREVAQSRDLPVDLVVLSACQTGLGRVSGDGMLGLSRAFLIAGARTVVVSQWSVNDGATKELMVAFYQNYLALGNKAIALQLAMQKVRSMSEYSAPRYWAAFVMVGAEV
jgi:tetratricopeptide (TPR) repeat protein